MDKKRILVVDDESGITGTLKVFLEDAGYMVCEQNDPLLVLETVRKFEPHLILLDYRMPGMNGDEIVLQLLQDEVLRGIQIVFISGSPKEEILERLPRKNFPILHKPIRMEAIRVFLERQKNCPKCGGAMILKAGRGEGGLHGRIWGCRRHPGCDGWLPFE